MSLRKPCVKKRYLTLLANHNNSKVLQNNGRVMLISCKSPITLILWLRSRFHKLINTATMEEKNYSQNTLSAYNKDLIQFQVFIKKNNNGKL
mgnify:CR=1 FL=1